MSRSGICLVALSETPRNAMWHTTEDTVVKIGTVVQGSPLHRYALIMLRAALLLGVSGSFSEGTASKVTAAMISPAAAAAAATTSKSQLDWNVLKTCARRQGELHRVGRPHVNSDRPLWIRWSNIPESFRTGYDYITPKQTQILSQVQERSAAEAAAKLDALWKQFKLHVNPKYPKGYPHALT